MILVGLALIIIGFFFFIFIPKLVKDKDMDYTKCNKGKATLFKTWHFQESQRWLAKIIDENGNQIIAIDDRQFFIPWRQGKLLIPQKNETYEVFYWESQKYKNCIYDNNVLNHQFHFVDERLYEYYKIYKKRMINLIYIISLGLIIWGLLLIFM